ncbi:MAG: iron-containing alcohol dehydrogenase [Mogibacterium sp.]|nr:iron-containing alcohol dehydrogenase [Mogibacterium sp.]MBQ6501452.1 iron-containing alcohol dehydrogenase [Mogibacterium sp.]
MKDFSWECRTKVEFGKGCVKEHLAHLVEEFALPGRSIMIGYGGGSVKRNGAYDDVISVLESLGYSRAGDPEEGRQIIEFPGIMSNPTLGKMKEGAGLASQMNVGLIIGIGGGSVMDCCKAISVQAGYDGDAWEDFWIQGKPMTHKVIPCGVVVTMPATGSEVNGCAVLTNEETHIKTDRDYPEMNPLFALMDPSYTLTMPLRQLRAGTFDILSHIMETYFSYPVEDNPADDVAEGLMRGLIRDFRAAVEDPAAYPARSNIMWAASLAENRIIKTGKTKDFQAHNMEHQLSAYTDCNHGEGLAVLHPVYYRHICKDGLGKFMRFADRVWGLDREEYNSDEAFALAGIEELGSFIKEIGLPTTLRELGFGKEEYELLPEIAESCFISQGAFRPLTKEEILEIYKECW